MKLKRSPVSSIAAIPPTQKFGSKLYLPKLKVSGLSAKLAPPNLNEISELKLQGTAKENIN